MEQQYGIRPKAVLGKNTKDVNDWVAQQTDRKVQNFLAAAFPQNPGVNAVSAAYFKGVSHSGRHRKLAVCFFEPLPFSCFALDSFVFPSWFYTIAHLHSSVLQSSAVTR